jgi:hypothetical protein
MKIKNERRKFRRLELSCPVEITSPKKVKGAKTKDISYRGLCIITSVGFKENSTLKIKLLLNQEENISISITGRVVWKMKKAKNEYHHGILITQIKDEERDIYRKFIATKLIDYLLS